jgi:LPPG:FO 2-phospho-L-lactate transferase
VPSYRGLDPVERGASPHSPWTPSADTSRLAPRGDTALVLDAPFPVTIVPAASSTSSARRPDARPGIGAADAACDDAGMRVSALAGGIGAARFLRGLLAHVAVTRPDTEVTVIGNTADDITLHGLHVSPDLDTVMYTLGGGIHPGQGWGRDGETRAVQAELAAYGAGPTWFTLGDRDIATHLVRTRMLGEGATLSEATAELCRRWQPGVRLLPMSDDPVVTHVTIADPEADDGTRTVHFQEYWVGLGAPPALAVTPVGAEKASPAPGVLEAIGRADVILIPPSNPVVSVGTILAVPGIREAIAANRTAPVVGLSPIIGGAPVRGMADRMLAAIGVETSAAAVALHYGARRTGGLLDGWLVDTVDATELPALDAAGISARAIPLLMRDVERTAAMAAAALELAAEIAAR